MPHLVTPSPALMERLKESTAELHRHAETRMLQKALLAGTLAPAVYSRYLIELRAVHHALEAGLSGWRERRPDLLAVFSDERRHTAHLDADIAALALRFGLAAESTPVAGTSARRTLVDLIAQRGAVDLMFLLGAFYVLEGSMNGNRFIARALASAWSISNADGLRYLDPYGDLQRDEWRAFRAAMSELAVTNADIDSAVQAACFMFESIARISDEVMDAEAS